MYKMRVLVFDTETSGLIPKKYESPECPYILQLACILVDTDGSKVNKIDSINDNESEEIIILSMLLGSKLKNLYGISFKAYFNNFTNNL